MAEQSMIGADVAALRNFARELDRAAADVLAARKYVNSIVVNNNAWFGPNFGMFVANWAKLAIDLTQVSGQLEAAGRTVRANADAQVAVSGDLGTYSAASAGDRSPERGRPAIGSRTGGSTKDFLDQLDADSDGIRIQKVVGDDQTVRYVVYLGGTGSGTAANVLTAFDADQLYDWGENGKIVVGVHSQTTEEIIRRMNAFGITSTDEILLVGFSQGGGQGELIAESGLYSKAVVINEGGPSTPGGDGRNVLRLEAADLPSNGIEEVSRVTAGRDGTIFDGGGSHTDHPEYGRAADRFDASTDPAHQHLQSEIGKFYNGTIVAEADTHGRSVTTVQYGLSNPNVVVEEVGKATGTVLGAIVNAPAAGIDRLTRNNRP